MDLAQLLTQRIPYTIAGMEQIKPQGDLVYKMVDETPLCLDVYHPPVYTNRSLNPAVIFIHGNWPPPVLPHVRALGQTVSWGQLMAAHGMTAVTFQHRTTQRHTRTAEAAEDVADLFRYLVREQQQLHIDLQQIALFAFSAGGLFSLWAMQQAAGLQVRCVVFYYGLMDLFWLEEVADGKDEVQQTFAAGNQLQKLPISPALLVVEAGQDDPVLNATIQRFLTTARACNAPITHLLHPEGPHGFERQLADQTTRALIHETVRFMQRHLASETKL